LEARTLVGIVIRSRRGSASRRPGGGRLSRWFIPAIGALTPVGLIVVNIAVFIVHHLEAFRWTITVLAFVSGMMLNSWAGLKIYRVFTRRYGEHALARERNQDVVLISGMAVIIVISFVTALFCYLGLSNEKNLPNATTFITGVAAILGPFILQTVFQRALGEGRSRDRPVSDLGAPAPPPPPPPLQRPAERRQ
jgi:hypothetical protein